MRQNARLLDGIEVGIGLTILVLGGIAQRGTQIFDRSVMPRQESGIGRADMPDADFSKWVSLEAAAEAIAYLASPANQAASGTLVPLYGRA